MKHIATAAATALASASVWADKYGIDEAMADGGDINLGDMVFWGLIAWGAWALWKRYR